MTTVLSTNPATEKQVNFLLDLAWHRCGATEEELDDYKTRFVTLNAQQASDLIKTWQDLPVQRTAPRPVKVSTSGPVLFQCIVCGCEFSSPIILEGHMTSVHGTAAPAVPQQFPCQVSNCAWVGADQNALDGHIARTHTTYKCYTCQAGFPSMHEVMEHKRIAHGGRLITPASPPATPPHPPAPAPAPAAYPIPSKGYYAAEVPVSGVMTMRFYRVREYPRNSGRFQFMRQSGDNFTEYIDPTERRMAAAIICAAPVLAMEMYGKLLGRCGCCRRSLTDPDSIARGIGPECIKLFPNRY